MYQHCSYGGYKHTYTQSKTSVSSNDQYSSVKISGCAQKDVIIYEHGSYGGKWLKITKNDSCFVNEGFNDKISSISIEPSEFFQNFTHSPFSFYGFFF